MNFSDQEQIGDMRVEEGLIDRDYLSAALVEQRHSGDRLGEILLKIGGLSEEDLKRTLSTQLDIPFE